MLLTFGGDFVLNNNISLSRKYTQLLQNYLKNKQSKYSKVLKNCDLLIDIGSLKGDFVEANIICKLNQNDYCDVDKDDLRKEVYDIFNVINIEEDHLSIENVEFGIIADSNDIEKPKVFISYCWSNQKYIDRVVDFSQRLVGDGVDVVLDQFQMRLGNDMNNFMEKCVKDPSITNVLILLSPDYKDKADNRKGGAGIETKIISSEVYNNVDNVKFIPVLFEKRGHAANECIPIYLKGNRYIDLSEDSDFEAQYVELVKNLYGKSKYVKNALGARPKWIDDDSRKYIESQIVINNYKTEKKEYNAEKAIDEISNKILSKLDEECSKFDEPNKFNNDDFEKWYPSFDDFKALYLSFLDEIVYENQVEEKIHDFLNEIYLYITKSKGLNFKLYILGQVLLHEIFIYTIAMLMKHKRYFSINYLTSVPYVGNLNYNKELATFQEIFYSISKDNIYNLDEYLGRKLYIKGHGRYCTGIGEFWKRNFIVKYFSYEDFVNADCLLTNTSIALEIHAWFAITYVYLVNGRSNLIYNIAVSLQSKKLANKYYVLFNSNNKDDFLMKYKLLKKYEDNYEIRLTHPGRFDSIPLIVKYIEEQDIEKFN